MSRTNPNEIINRSDYIKVINELTLRAERNEELEEENQQLRRNCELYRKALYGQKSERFIPDRSNPNQTKLFESSIEDRPKVEDVGEIEVKSYTRKKRKRYTDKDGNLSHFPPELPREDVPLEPEGMGEKCDGCGKDKVRLFDKITERLCEIPVQYKVKRFIRPVYGCKCGSCAPESAPAPDGALPKSCLDISFLAASQTKKYAWHIPFNRQSLMLKELGIDISRDVLISSSNKLGKLLAQIVKWMLIEIRFNDLVQMDESPITVARRVNGKIQYSKSSYYWPILAGKQVVFVYSGDRKHSNVADILGVDFEGILLSDGYQAYEEYCRANERTSLALCWDHARRRFKDIVDKEPVYAQEALILIGRLYRVEREIKELIKDGELSPDKIPQHRKQHALPHLNTLKEWLETVRDAPSTLPKSDLMGACSYIINHWNGLTLYLEYGNVPISNITVEQQIRNLKLGAKNWLFAASEAGAHTIAVMNSLVCSCRLNDINVLEYFNDILARLDSIPAKYLTPAKWAQYKNFKNPQK